MAAEWETEKTTMQRELEELRAQLQRANAVNAANANNVNNNGANGANVRQP